MSKRTADRGIGSILPQLPESLYSDLVPNLNSECIEVAARELTVRIRSNIVQLVPVLKPRHTQVISSLAISERAELVEKGSVDLAEQIQENQIAAEWLAIQLLFYLLGEKNNLSEVERFIPGDDSDYPCLAVSENGSLLELGAAELSGKREIRYTPLPSRRGVSQRQPYVLKAKPTLVTLGLPALIQEGTYTSALEQLRTFTGDSASRINEIAETIHTGFLRIRDFEEEP